MRTGTVTLNEKSYLLCFSARVMRLCVERYGGMEHIGDALEKGDSGKILDECFWLLAAMMNAGDRYAKLEGLENPVPLSLDDLYDLCGVEELAHLKDSIRETISSGVSRSVETQLPKDTQKNLPARKTL